MATNPRFWYRPEGQQFLDALGALMQRVASDPASTKQYGEAYTQGGNGRLRARTGDLDVSPVAAWDEVLVAFRQGLFAVANVPAADQVRLGPDFDRRVTEIYWTRFSEVYPDVDVERTKAQAIVLGQLTASVYRLKKGELADGDYPVVDPNVQLSVEHLEWARDVLGFWLMAKNRWHVTMPRDGAPFQFGGVAFEFEKGCTLC
jgi:hypothetical protein